MPNLPLLASLEPEVARLLAWHAEASVSVDVSYSETALLTGAIRLTWGIY